jgi:hypothetical protein
LANVAIAAAGWDIVSQPVELAEVVLGECLLNGILTSDNRRMGLENGLSEEPNAFVGSHEIQGQLQQT